MGWKGAFKVVKISEILTELGAEGVYSTDKNRCRKYAHCYGKAYDHLLKPFGENIEIVEIGIEYGPSLEAWQRAFPNAKITGIDIVDKVVHKHEGIEYVFDDVKNIIPDKAYDIVIDDGSHKLKDVLHVVEHFKLKEGGVMVIEDCQAPRHWEKAIREITKYTVELIDLRSINGQKDDYLIALHNYGYYQ